MTISVNIKTNYGAVGDGQLVTATLSITAGDNHLSSTTNLWTSPGDVGKIIYFDLDPSAAGSFYLLTSIESVTDAQNIVLGSNATHTLSSSTQLVAWGTNDNDAFAAFNAAQWGASEEVDLTIPAGVYLLYTTSANDERLFRGIPLLRVTGAGSDTTVIAGTFFLGGFDYPATNQITGRIASVSKGSTTLQLLDPVSDAATFTAGRTITQSDGIVYTFESRIIISDQDMQGFGDPNHFTWEYANVSSIDAGTGVITLTSPIENSYLSTYPLYDPGSSTTADLGGPATIYAVDYTWDYDIGITDVGFFNPAVLTSMSVKNFSITGCKWYDQLGPDPSVNDQYIIDSCDLSSCFTEIDKNVSDIIVRNGTTWRTFWNQSASIKNLTATDSTIGLKGVPRVTNLTGCTFTDPSVVGVEAYGRADSITADSCVFDSLDAKGASDQNIVGIGFTVSDGVISWPKSNSSVRWANPGTWVMFQGQYECETMFQVTAVGEDTDNTLVYTNLPPGDTFPDVPLEGGTRLDVMAHPAPKVFFTNCTGCDDAVDLSNAGAYGRPYASYSLRTYTAGTSAGKIPLNSIPQFRMWGTIRQINVNVTQAYTGTGVGSLSLNIFGQFHCVALDPSHTSTSSYNPSIDLKTTGLRTITADSVTPPGWLGADSGLGPPGAIWFAGKQTPFVSADVSGEDPSLWPIVSIEVITDQFQSGGSVVPISLGLHS